MRKIIKILLIFVLPFILIVIICFYVFIANTNRLPYKNYSDFSTGSGYIYSQVSYCDTVQIVVIPNSSFYDDLKHYLYNDKYNTFFYIAKISFSNFFGMPISINKNLYDNIKFDIIEPKLISKYENVDITKENYIKGHFFQDSIKRQDKRALIYLLLKREIRNCSNDCETGSIIIY